MQKYKKVKKTFKKAKMQKRLLKSLTNHQGVNTLGKKITCNNAKIQKSQKDLKKQKCLLKRKKDFLKSKKKVKKTLKKAKMQKSQKTF